MWRLWSGHRLAQHTTTGIVWYGGSQRSSCNISLSRPGLASKLQEIANKQSIRRMPWRWFQSDRMGWERKTDIAKVVSKPRCPSVAMHAKQWQGVWKASGSTKRKVLQQQAKEKTNSALKILWLMRTDCERWWHWAVVIGHSAGRPFGKTPFQVFDDASGVVCYDIRALPGFANMCRSLWFTGSALLIVKQPVACYHNNVSVECRVIFPRTVCVYYRCVHLLIHNLCALSGIT